MRQRPARGLFQLRHDGSVEPAALPETGYSTSLDVTMDDLLYEDAIYGTSLVGSGEPEDLVIDWDAIRAIISGAGATPTGLPRTGRGADYVHLNPSAIFEGERAPQELPVTGSGLTSLMPSPWYSTASAMWDDEVIGALTGFPVEIVGEPAVLPETGSTGLGDTTVSGFVWDGMAYVADSVSEPPLVLPVTGSAGNRPLLNGAYNEEFTSQSDLAPLAAPAALPQAGVSLD